MVEANPKIDGLCSVALIPWNFNYVGCHLPDNCRIARLMQGSRSAIPESAQLFVLIYMSSTIRPAFFSTTNPVAENNPSAPVRSSSPGPNLSAGGSSGKENPENQRARFINRILGIGSKPAEKTAVVFGCGREGNRFNVSNKAHRHEQNGEGTVDIDAETNPNVVADMTTNLTSSPEFLALGPVPKVKIEAVPLSVYNSAEKRENILANIDAITTGRHRIKATTGVGDEEAAKDVASFVGALRDRGYTIKKHAIDQGQWQVKAEKK